MFKKLHLFLASLLLLGATTASANGTLVGELYYIFSGTNATVTYPGDATPTSGNNAYTGDIDIPATVTYNSTTYNVTAIGDNAFQYSTVTSFTFHEGLISIGKNSLSNITTITEITFPNSFTTLAEGWATNAFCECTNLQTITFGTGLKTIGSGCFYSGLSNIKDVYFNGPIPTIGSYFATNTKAKITFHIPAEYADGYVNSTNFNNGSSTIKTAKDGIYYLLKGQNAVVTYPGSTAPDATGTNSYNGDVTIPAYVTFGNYTFNVTEIGENAFRYSTITSVTFSEGLEVLNSQCFQYCTGLTNVVLPNSVTTIAYWNVFGDCSNLQTLTLGMDLTSISQGMAWGCGNLNDIYIKARQVPSPGAYMCYSGVKIHVPADMLADYQANSTWGNTSSYTLVGDYVIDYTYTDLQVLAEELYDYKRIVGDPNGITTASFAQAEAALATFETLSESSSATDINACAIAIIEAEEAFAANSNTVTEGYYFIASAGNGPGYSGGPYNYEDVDAIYNNGGNVMWKAFDKTDLGQVYYITDYNSSTSPQNKYLYNILDGTYIGNSTGNGSNISTTTDATNYQRVYAANASSGKYAIRTQSHYAFALAGGHNGSSNASGNLKNWGSESEAINSYKVNLWYFHAVPEADVAEMANAKLRELIADKATLYPNDDPNRYPAAGNEAFITAYNNAQAAITTGTVAEKIAAYKALENATLSGTVNAITEGYYFIVSAGNGTGYPANSGNWYNYEDKNAMYNDGSIVKWEAYDNTDANQVYYLTQKEDNSWYVYNVMDASYIDNGGSGNSGTVYTSADKVNAQKFHTMALGSGKFAIESPSYCYGLAQNHNGSPNASGNLCIWGTVSDCTNLGVNQWYLHKISNADAEQLIANAVVNTNSVVPMPTNETGGHTNVVFNGQCESLVLTDGQPFSAPSDFTATTATYTRTMANEWGTICLPYDVSSSATTKYYTISAIENNSLVVNEVATLTAGTPALVQKVSGESVTATATNVPVSATINNTTGSVNMYGVFEKTKVEDANAYYIKDNKFWQCNNYFFCGAFRAYFTTGSAPSPSFDIIIDGDDPTAIASAEAGDNEPVAIYSTDGTRLGTLRSGINIVKQANGKTRKVFVK